YTGGADSYTWSMASGNLPAGLSLNYSGQIYGTPTAAGTSDFTVQLVDTVGGTATASLSITISVGPAIATTSLSEGNVNAAYSETVYAAGGTTPYTWSIASGTLPAGLSLDSFTGAITGMPTTAGTYNFTVQVTDDVGDTATASLSITISAAPGITTAWISDGEVGIAFSGTVTATGGTTPYTWSIASGTLPAGLSLDSSTGAISGTPTAAGAYSFAVRVAGDDEAASTQGLFYIYVSEAPSITTTSLPDGNVGVAYHQYPDSTGGISPYTWSIASGNLPAGLSLASYSGRIYGTPTTVGTWYFTVQLVDDAGVTATASLSITISAAPAILTAGLPEGNVNAAYSETMDAAGGTTPYTWSITPGTLPAGLLLDSSTGAITGTPTTAGTFNFTVQVTDNVGGTASANLSITVSAAPGIVTAGLPNGEFGIAYSGTVTATGGTTPYTWSIASGTFPAGLSLNSSTGAITGTPTAIGWYDFTVQIAGYDGATSTEWLEIYISGALSITTASLPDGNVGVDYYQYPDTAGGISPYTWSIASGTLPDGLWLDSWGEIYGTPTTVGTWDFTLQLVDGAGVTATASLSITISPAPAILTTWLSDGNVNAAYSETLDAAGGTMPYTWSTTPGNLPAGLSLDSATGAIAGTPTAAGTYHFTVQVTDNVGGTATANLSITISAAPGIITTSLPDGEFGIAYSSTVTATGGTTPYAWSIVYGTLPAGLSLDSATGAITGTPTAIGWHDLIVQVAGHDGATSTHWLLIDISGAPLIATTSLPDGNVGVDYDQYLDITGGISPYTWSIASGTLPDGLLLDSWGEVHGTPTTVGTWDFTVQLVDGAEVTATASLSIAISAAPAITTTWLPDGNVNAAYSETVDAAGGTTPYTWSITSGTLPAGLLLDSSTGAITGTPTTAGTFNFTVRATDNVAGTATASLSISISAAPGIITTSLPDGEFGIAYSSTVTATFCHRRYHRHADSDRLVRLRRPGNRLRWGHFDTVAGDLRQWGTPRHHHLAPRWQRRCLLFGVPGCHRRHISLHLVDSPRESAPRAIPRFLLG
ncbi:MAG: Ig domain-containing protein, partial [Chloroflexi bacterium]|nr:Ig domain-containing protein [Chloroflexota bacterium]